MKPEAQVVRNDTEHDALIAGNFQHLQRLGIVT